MSTTTKDTNPSGSPPKTPSPEPRKPKEFVTPPTDAKPEKDELQGELDKFFEGIKDIDEAQRKLLTELYIANGQDAFDAEAAAVGRLKQEEYLALPRGFAMPRITPVNVGRAHVRSSFPAQFLAAVYLMNKERAPSGENAVTYAFIRMEAVKMGWVENQKEIIYLAFDRYADAIRELATDLAGVRNQLSTFRLAAFLVPLVCEHTFRVTGHHYITGLASDYQTRYRKTLKACLSEELMQLLQPATLFHHVLHWVSPARAYNVMNAQISTQTLPDAIVIRANAAPAGWAIITTTAAVIEAMDSANVSEQVKEAFDGDLEDVETAAKNIKGDVRKWHKAYFAYGVPPPTREELDDMEDSKATAISFAPYAQGFIEGTLKDAALGQAQALKKHAELNPVARQRAARFFRQLTRVQVGEVKDLFQTKLNRPTAAGDDE